MKIHLKNLFIFFLCLYSFKSIENLQTITIKNETIKLDYISLPSYFRIIIDSELNLTNYIKIQVDQNNITENFNYLNYTNFCISFYQQDSNFKERKQLSQSSLGASSIWLNKKQVSNIFYISIEGANISSNFTLSLFLKETAEINLNEQYTYYVLEENQEMNFTIVNEELSEVITQNLITIWAKGSKEITSKLDIPYLEKHSKYNAYLIYQEEFKEFKYYFTVYGKIGDIINIGSILFELEDDIISHKLFKNTEIELTGFLKKGKIEKNCYKFDKINLFFEQTSYVIYDYIDKLGESNQYNYNLENYDLKCIEFPENLEAEELFYSIHYIPIENNKTYSERMNKFFPIQINGLNYKKNIKNGETIGLIPIMPEDDFNYLTYYVNTLKGKTNISIYSCETYPLCDVNLNNIKDIIPIQNYYSFSFSFSKNELNANILSNIHPEKKIMLITCENKNEIRTDIGIENDICIIDANIYTDKNNLLMSKDYNYHKYTRKNNEDKYIIIPLNERNPIYINLEILSGNISININYQYLLYEKNNKKLYSITNIDKNKYEFSIFSETDSAYNIRYFIPEFISDPYMLMSGGNYLFSISKNNSELEEAGIKISNSFEYLETPQNQYFIGFYPLNCKINIEYYYFPFDFRPMKEKKGFYQDIYDQNSQDNKYIGYRITKNENITDDCLFYVSVFKYNNETIYDNNGIFLADNVSQLFSFNNNYSIFTFSYIYTRKDKDVNIILRLLNEENYELNLFINNLEIKNNYNIIKDEKIIIKSKDIKDICKNEQQICKISFSLNSKNIFNESIIEIKINTENNEEQNNSNNNNNNKTILIIEIISVLAIIGLIIIIVILFNRKKNNINNEIENIQNDTQTKILNDKDN